MIVPIETMFDVCSKLNVYGMYVTVKRALIPSVMTGRPIP